MFGAACAVKQVIHGVCEVWCFCYFSRDGGKQGVAAPCLSHIIYASCIHVVHTSHLLSLHVTHHRPSWPHTCDVFSTRVACPVASVIAATQGAATLFGTLPLTLLLFYSVAVQMLPCSAAACQ